MTSVPPELLELVVQQGGPTVGIVVILWWRINKLEQRFSARLDRLDDDVSSNSSLIYDRLLGQQQQRQYPKPDQEAARRDADPPRSSSD